MPYYHCRKCMHEFEFYGDGVPVCDWCHTARPIVLEYKTPLEKLCEGDRLIKMLGELNDKKGSDTR